MFIGCPSSSFQYKLDELGGVRIITRYVPAQVKEGDAIAVHVRENTFSFTSMDLAAVRAFRERDNPAE